MEYNQGKTSQLALKVIWLVANYLLCFLSAFDINGCFFPIESWGPPSTEECFIIIFEIVRGDSFGRIFPVAQQQLLNCASSVKAFMRGYYSVFQISTCKLTDSLKKQAFLTFFHDLWGVVFAYFSTLISLYCFMTTDIFHPLADLKTRVKYFLYEITTVCQNQKPKNLPLKEKKLKTKPNKQVPSPPTHPFPAPPPPRPILVLYIRQGSSASYC